MTTDTIELQTSLSQFIGTEKYHFNPLYRWMNYTDGVQYFAKNAGGGAYWFLDIVGTEVQPLTNRRPFLTVDLVVRSYSDAEIVVTDGNDNHVWTKKINGTDCPVGTWRFFLQRGVLMLTSEY